MRHWLVVAAILLSGGQPCSSLGVSHAANDTLIDPFEERQGYVQEFPLGAVTLQPGSPAARAADLNRQYMLMIDPDSLLWTFRNTAGLPHDKGTPYFGSWEDPAVEVRGEFTGHYLSAVALDFNYTGEEAIKAVGAYLVQELKKCQDAIGTGYLSAFAPEHFDRLQNLQPVWAPFYVIHKIMAGLLDQYRRADNDLALSVVLDLADWVVERVDDIVRVNGTARWHETLETEFGGMQEVMVNLWSLTNNTAYLRNSDLFVKPHFADPLVKNIDNLENLHANTHLAQVNGFAARYEHTADANSLAATRNFFHHLTSAHSFASGGSNDNEFWQAAHELGRSFDKDMGINTQESCTQYNVLKIARSLFRWTSDVKYADFYERALTNGVLGIARLPPQEDDSAALPQLPSANPTVAGHVVQPERLAAALHSRSKTAALHSRSGLTGPHDTNKPGPGVYLYHTPQGRSGVAKADNFHGWGHRFTSFWCCYGTAVESLSKLADSIFFWRHADSGLPVLYINQLLPSTLRWEAVGVEVVLDSSLFRDDGFVVASLSFNVGGGQAVQHPPKPATIDLKVRMPAWTEAEKAELSLDSHPIKCNWESPGYCTVVRSFRTGQRLGIKFPMEPRLETLQDARPVFQAFKSVMIGPHVYAGLTHDSRVFVADPADIASLVQPLSTEGHLSLAPVWASSQQPAYLRHDLGGLYVSELQDGGDALDATFRLVTGLAARGADRKQQTTLDVSRLQAWLHGSGGNQPVALVSLEAVSMPGAYLGFETYNFGWRMPSSQGTAVFSSQPGRKQVRHTTFVLHRGLSGETGTLSLELSDRPGYFLSTYMAPAEPNNSVMEFSYDSKCEYGGDQNAWYSPEIGLACARWNPKFRRLQALPVPPAATAGFAPFAQLASFRVTAPQGRVPEGSKLLAGKDRSYIISPLSSIVDERYTAYFEWVHPHTMRRRRLWRSICTIFGYSHWKAAIIVVGLLLWLPLYFERCERLKLVHRPKQRVQPRPQLRAQQPAPQPRVGLTVQQPPVRPPPPPPPPQASAGAPVGAPSTFSFHPPAASHLLDETAPEVLQSAGQAPAMTAATAAAPAGMSSSVDPLSSGSLLRRHPPASNDSDEGFELVKVGGTSSGGATVEVYI